MNNRVFKTDPATGKRSSLAMDYAVERPETKYVHAVGEALINGRVVEFRKSLQAMHQAGFDPLRIRLAVNSSDSDAKVALGEWVLNRSDQPKRLFRALVEANVGAENLLHGLLIKDRATNSKERWAWPLLLSHLSPEERWAARPIENQHFTGTLVDVPGVLNAGAGVSLRGTAVHQALLSCPPTMMAELLKHLGPMPKGADAHATFTPVQALLWRLARPGTQFDWPHLMAGLNDDDLLAFAASPIARPHMTDQDWPSVFAWSQHLASTSLGVSNGLALETLVKRLGVRLVPLLVDPPYVRTPAMKAPVFDRLDELLFHVQVAEPRQRLLEQQPIPEAARQRPRYRS